MLNIKLTILCNLIYDSNQAIHVGSNCCCINDYKCIENKTKQTLENISIFSFSKEMILGIARKISITSDSPQIKIPTYPILDNIHYPKVCALIAVGIGCDVHLYGTRLITPRTIFIFSKRRKARTHYMLIYLNL